MYSEYFYERSSRTRLPLVFEISVALDKCAATEQLKNLTAKTEIRDVVVVARAFCITQLLEEVMTFGFFSHYSDFGLFCACHSDIASFRTQTLQSQ